MQHQQQSDAEQPRRKEDQNHELVLLEQERQSTAAVLANQPLHNPHQRHSLEYFLNLKMLAAAMPERVKCSLERFRSNPKAYPQGYFVLRGFPKDQQRRTPRTYACPVRDSSTIAELSCLTVASALGDPFALANEQDQRNPNAIIALEGKEADASSASSKSSLGFHGDNYASGDACATWLVLACVKPDAERKGATTVASLYEAMDLITSPSLRILRQPIFKVSAPAAFSGKAESVTVPAIGGSDAFPWLTYRSYGLEPADPDNVVARYALQEMEDALTSVVRHIKMEAGDLLCLRNGFTPWNVVHGRSEYEAHFDERYVDNRYLVRAYVHRDITQILDYCYPGTHVLTPTELYRAAFPNHS